jgi:hypothetical protein
MYPVVLSKVKSNIHLAASIDKLLPVEIAVAAHLVALV